MPVERPVQQPVETQGRNLLAYRPVAAVLRSRLYPAVFQWLTTLVFVVIIWQLVLGPSSAHDNLGTALTWVLWWPLIPIVFLLLGGFWCAVCPFGWLSDQVQRLVGIGRLVPAFLKRYGIWIIDASFLLITWADHVWGIVESPWGSGLLLLGFWADTLAWLASVTGTSSYAVNYTIFAVSLPVGLLYAASRAAAQRGGTARDYFAAFGYALIPLDVAGHIAHNLFHLLAEGKSIAVTALALVGREGGDTSTALVGNDTIQVLQYLLIALGVAGSLYTAQRIAASRSTGRSRPARRLLLAPYVTLVLALAAVNGWLFALPMAHRM